MPGSLKFKKSLELLCPAKDKNCAIAAINFGADAIYLGAVDFGARKSAPNSIEDIKEVADYAHKFFAKVFVTINTILDDKELESVQKLLFELYSAGVDGIIVQDFGIFKLKLPPFIISASTQCDIRDIEKVRFFEKIGVQRVILARELPLDKIREICKNTKLEIETFIHGALCVSYSGQCYLSYALGKRSANRGECAQPCRKKYTLVDDCGKIYSKDKHLLSLKDFCAAPYLKDLIDAGVTSFKIEGRLKDENYVKNTTAYYNKMLGSYKRASSGKVFLDFEPDINKTFNRGFCTYFLSGKRNEIYNFKTPGQTGEKLGCVCAVGKNYIDIKTKIKINPQDGLCRVKNNAISGFLVNKSCKIEGKTRIFPNTMPEIKTGDVIFRNFDSEFDKILKNSKTKRQIGVKLSVFKDKIKAIDEDLITAQVEISGEKAKNAQVLLDIYEKQLKKSGGSDFFIENIEFKDKNLPFLKISDINNLRRKLLDKLMEKRLEAYEKNRAARAESKICPAKFPLKNNDYRLNVHNKKAFEFYNDCGIKCLQRSFESGAVKNTEQAELMRTKHCLRHAFNMCLKTSKKAGGLYLIDEKGAKLKLEFDCKNCEMIIKKP